MKVDSKGNLYSVNAVGPGEIWITSPEGKHLGTLELPQIQGEPRPRICATNWRSAMRMARVSTLRPARTCSGPAEGSRRA